ncbi:heavy metal translocating P-type ATPase [Thalassolituus sp. LLYu03]|uniref:heavy metal translocating P-type ATPase n=1 Tax=Thalassolituus sp. LLYu03 TaxID=3421656 RepID=UPI003D29BAFC
MSAASESERCFHCGEPGADASRWSVMIDGESRAMCCPGCKAIAETIVASGLKDYYRHRTHLPELTPADFAEEDLTARESLTLYDSDALQRRFVARNQGEQGNLAEATFIIDGISCAACAWLIEHRVGQLPGVEQAVLNLSTHRLVVRWQYDAIKVSSIAEAIYRLGYKASPFSATQDEEQRDREGKLAIRRLAVAGIGTMQVMMLAVPLYVGMAEQYEFFMRMASMVLTLPVVLFSARPFFDAAYRDLKTRHLTMDVPVSLAIALAFCSSIWSTFNMGKEIYFDSVCMFTFFLLLGRFMEMRARHRMGKAGNNLLTLLPNIALRVNAAGEEEVISSEDIMTGDLLRLKPGHAIPADGIVTEGRSSVDEAALTGEYLPIRKQPGDALIGGTFNVESPMLMKVTATGAEAQLSTIMRLMDRAQQEKPKAALIADRIASRFVLAVLLVSASVFTFWFLRGDDHAFFIALSVLVVTCPCALSLATPTALTAATATLRERGLLISKGHVLETLTQVNRVVFDKTGTLTQGRLTLEQVVPLANLNDAELTALVAGLEKHSTHPIARAFRSVRAADVTQVEQFAGQGIMGIHNAAPLRFGRADFAWPDAHLPQPDMSLPGQWLLLANGDQPLGWFRLNDSLRRNAADIIDGLKQRGIKVSLLTGDPGESGPRLARELGIDDLQKGVSPEQKLQAVRNWQAAGEVVLMVGDGINDVPVLAGANIALAVNEASDLAKTNADAMLTNGRLEILLTALDGAVKTRRIIIQNIGWALLYNLIALPVAAAGFVPPWAAAIGMSASSLIVVTNALRLTRLPVNRSEA